MVMMNYSMLGLQMNLLWEPIDLGTVQLQEKFRNYLIDTDFCESLILWITLATIRESEKPSLCNK